MTSLEKHWDRWCAIALLAAFALAALHAAGSGAIAFDEQHYLVTAREMLRGEWDASPLARIQPPLGLWASGLAALGIGDAELVDGGGLVRSRLPMVAIGVTGGALLYAWLRHALGRKEALLGLLVYATHPILVGYSALVAVDIWHATTTLALAAALWSSFRAPTLARHALVGLALGAALGTKYFALLDAPVVALACMLAELACAPAPRTSRSTARALARGACGALASAAASVLALHACYGFSAPLAGLEHGAGWTEVLPGGAWFAALLPAPFVAGVELAREIGETPRTVFLNEAFAPGHADYYAWSLLLKSPLAALALLGIAIATRARAWLRDPAARDERVLVCVCAALAYAQGLGLSIGTSFQLGIRYVLPILPLCCCIAACAARAQRWNALSSRARLALGAALVAWLALDLARARDNPIAYFNPLAGGQARAYRHFADSNCDWRQARASGERALRARYGERLTFLRAGDGPRLGLVAAYVDDLARPDPIDPRRSRHWLDAFAPIDHFDAAWYVFDVEYGWYFGAAIRADDARVRAELALALLGAGRLDDARAWIESTDPLNALGDAKPALSRLLALLERPERDANERAELVTTWLAHDRPDLAVAEALRVPPDELGAAREPFLLALLRLGDWQQLERTVEARPLAQRGGVEVLLLAQAQHEQGRLLDALDLLARNDAALRRDVPAQAQLALRKLRQEWELTPSWVRDVWSARHDAGEAAR